MRAKTRDLDPWRFDLEREYGVDGWPVENMQDQPKSRPRRNTVCCRVRRRVDLFLWKMCYRQECVCWEGGAVEPSASTMPELVFTNRKPTITAQGAQEKMNDK